MLLLSSSNVEHIWHRFLSATILRTQISNILSRVFSKSWWTLRSYFRAGRFVNGDLGGRKDVERNKSHRTDLYKVEKLFHDIPRGIVAPVYLSRIFIVGEWDVFPPLHNIYLVGFHKFTNTHSHSTPLKWSTLSQTKANHVVVLCIDKSFQLNKVTEDIFIHSGVDAIMLYIEGRQTC